MSPSRLGIYCRSRPDDMAARAFQLQDPIKGKPCECKNMSVAEELALPARPASPVLLAAAYNKFPKILSYNVE